MWFGATGIWWFLLALGYTLVGIGVMVGAVLALTYFTARAAVDFAKHPRDCQCGPCQESRLRALHRAHRNRPNAPRPPDDRDIKPTGNEAWISTVELREGMYVVGGKDRSQVYRVDRVEHTEFGYTIRLINARTRKLSITLVPQEKAFRPIWLVMANEER